MKVQLEKKLTTSYQAPERKRRMSLSLAHLPQFCKLESKIDDRCLQMRWRNMEMLVVVVSIKCNKLANIAEMQKQIRNDDTNSSNKHQAFPSCATVRMLVCALLSSDKSQALTPLSDGYSYIGVIGSCTVYEITSIVAPSLLRHFTSFNYQVLQWATLKHLFFTLVRWHAHKTCIEESFQKSRA